ncbi:MAG: hypothetical protein P4L34_11515 [Paludibacter sp.]|nr:hypothetical protein [Paludibacter sp.]
MGNSKVSKDFSTGKYTDAGLSSKTNFIVGEMTDNAAFATPIPLLKDVTDANNEYIVALGKVEYGSKADTVIKNNLRAALTVLLKQLADYVQTTSNGDEARILSSGFDVNKKPATIGQLAKPIGFSVKPGTNKGSMILSCNVVSNADFYEFEYMELPVTPNSVWIQRTSTKSKLVMDGLISGKLYNYRVAGAGSDPSRIWSDEISSYVL